MYSQLQDLMGSLEDCEIQDLIALALNHIAQLSVDTPFDNTCQILVGRPPSLEHVSQRVRSPDFWEFIGRLKAMHSGHKINKFQFQYTTHQLEYDLAKGHTNSAADMTERNEIFSRLKEIRGSIRKAKKKVREGCCLLLQNQKRDLWGLENRVKIMERAQSAILHRHQPFKTLLEDELKFSCPRITAEQLGRGTEEPITDIINAWLDLSKLTAIENMEIEPCDGEHPEHDGALTLLDSESEDEDVDEISTIST